MSRRFITISALVALFTGLPLCVWPYSQAAGQQQQKQSKSQPKKGADSMTGCVDEQNGRYVLVDDRNLTPVANLEADGFPTEGFAKHMGHKVTVRGTLNSSGTTPLFKVSSIEVVSETCQPQPK